MPITLQPFGSIGGKAATAFTLSHPSGLSATITDYGATLTRLSVPDKKGDLVDIVLGYDTLEQYRASPTYFGATAGRYGNRIREGRFTIEGVEYRLATNEGRNHLHGGFVGFDKCLFEASSNESENAITFRLVSPDGDQGYPGALSLTVCYEIGDSVLRVTMQGTTDRPTLCNPVHHSYWNLAGHNSGDVLGHELEILADFYTPCDDELMTTGEVLSVKGTPFDFRVPKAIGRDLAKVPNAGAGRSDDGGAGYDHNWCLRQFDGRLRPVIRARDPVSGRSMMLVSDQAGVHMYSGGYLGPEIVGKGDHPYCRFAGFTLETQTYPDSPNFTHFPPAILRPGEVYLHRMEFHFSATGPGPIR